MGSHPDINESILSSLREGDVSAFNTIYDHYGKRVYYFSLSYLKSEQDAEEIVQEVFLKIWKGRAELTKSDTLEAYIFIIARNGILNFIRKQNHEKVFLKYKNLFPDRSLLVDEEVYFNELQNHYDQAVEKLSPRKREVYRLSREMNLSNKEIAGQMNLSVKTVENQMTAAIAEIKATLRALDY